MIDNIRHFGFKVESLEASSKFYLENGYEIYYDENEHWEEFGELAIIKLKKNNEPSIELIKTDSNLYKSHLCFEVNDVDFFYRDNNEKYKFIVKPVISNDGSVKVCFYESVKSCLLFEAVEVIK